MKEVSLYSIPKIRIGHCSDIKGGTGVSVIICEEGAVGGVDVRGGAPGTRETDVLNPVNLVDKVHGIVLSGGSAFGLAAATGVMNYLEERNIGFDVGVTKVPIVSQAVLFDLPFGSYKARPDEAMGYKACEDSEKDYERKDGNIGAGTGATVGKILGPTASMKGGLGTFCYKIGDLYIGAIVAVNCLGDVIDPSTGEKIAGVRLKDGKTIGSTEEIMIAQINKESNRFTGNTTIGAVITNAKVTKAKATKIASMAQNGYGRSIYPAHTMADGDTIFTIGTGEVEADISTLGHLAARVVEKAVINGVMKAENLHNVPSYNHLRGINE